MSFPKLTRIDNLQVNCKEDMNQIVLVPVDRDYHGNTIYDHRTVWSCIDDINVFIEIVSKFTNEELMSFKDEFNGNLLAGIAEAGRGVEFFQVLAEKLGKETVCDMLLTYDRRHICPLALIRDLESFIILLDDINIDADTLRQICHHNTNDVVDHLACMINSVSSIEVAVENQQ